MVKSSARTINDAIVFVPFPACIRVKDARKKNGATKEGVELESGWALEPERRSRDAQPPEPPFNYTHLLRPHSWQRAAAFTDTVAARFSRSLSDASATFTEITRIVNYVSRTGLIVNFFTQTRKSASTTDDSTQTSRTQLNNSRQTQVKAFKTVSLTNQHV